MNMKQVVQKLQTQGHSVSYYVRKDGGILIKSIDGERFPTGASGNARARQLVGATISEARSSQLKFATRARKFKHPTLDDEIKREWERVKKKWNKVFKAKEGKPHPAGYFGWNRINRTIKEYGREEALRRIREAEKYSSGLAYSKNVEYLIQLIRDAGNKKHSQALLKLADDLQENAYTIRDEWIKPAYDRLYDLNEGAPPEDVARDVRAILRLVSA